MVSLAYNIAREPWKLISVSGVGSGTASPATRRKRKSTSDDGDGTPTTKKASPKKKVVDIPTNDYLVDGEDVTYPTTCRNLVSQVQVQPQMENVNRWLPSHERADIRGLG